MNENWHLKSSFFLQRCKGGPSGSLRRALNSPCLWSRWTEGRWRSSAPPAGTQCSWWRCAESPLWEAAAQAQRWCSASASRRRHLLCWGAAFPAWWPPCAGRRGCSAACRLCRPTVGSGRPGGGPMAPSRAAAAAAAHSPAAAVARHPPAAAAPQSAHSSDAAGCPSSAAEAPGHQRSWCQSWGRSRGRRRSRQRWVRRAGRRDPSLKGCCGQGIKVAPQTFWETVDRGATVVFLLVPRLKRDSLWNTGRILAVQPPYLWCNGCGGRGCGVSDQSHAPEAGVLAVGVTEVKQSQQN